jgi:putative membrane protein
LEFEVLLGFHDMNGIALLAEAPGVNGFLGSRASLMVDVVFLAMFLVLPVLGWSIWQVKVRRRFLLHKRVQLTLAAVLLMAVTAFEIDMRFISGWRQRAEPSPYWASGVVTISLCIHLVFSITSFCLWLYVVIGALRNVPNPPGPSSYSPRHIFWARLAAIDMVLTAITGWIFYWLAFVV